MASLDQIERALRNAHAAGDTAAATRLAQAYREAKRAQGDVSRVTGPQMGVNMMTFGLSDAIGNAGIAAIDTMMGKGEGFLDNYGRVRDQRQVDVDSYRDHNAGSAAAHEIAGGLVGGANAGQGLGLLASKATSMLPQAASTAITKAAGTMPGRIATGAAEGAGIGAATAYGMGGDVQEGAGVGALTAALAYPAIRAARAAAKPVMGVLGLGNKGRAREAIEQVVNRSGKSSQQIASDMIEARNLGKDQYTLADATGEAGARALRGARGISSERGTRLVDELAARQAGQAGRLTEDVSTAFGAKDTARAAEGIAARQRRTEAKVNYGAARDGAQPVDVSGPVNSLRSMLPDDPARDTSIQAAARGLLARLDRSDGTGVADLNMNFDDLLAFKKELDDLASTAYRAGRGNEGELYANLRNQIDGQLEAASGAYANARNTYRQQSREMEAIGMGQTANRQRLADTLADFQNLPTPAAKQAFRIGRADTILKGIENKPSNRNLAQPMMTERTAAEFPGLLGRRGDRLNRQIDIENQMAKTNQIATQGSRTDLNVQDAGSVGDMVDMGRNAVMGNIGNVVTGGVRMAVNAAAGRNTKVRDMIIDTLMSRAPDEAMRIIQEAELAGQLSRGATQAIARALAIGAVAGQAQSQ